jgi:hypothetical protein
MAIYVKNSDLLEEIIVSKEQKKLTPRAFEMLMKIANESNKKLRYKNPLDKEDCISSAIEDLLKYWDRFDPAKSNNPFAFYTQIAKNGYGKVWKKLHPEGFDNMLSLSQDNVHNNFC